MKTLNIQAIRIDGGTQSRCEINEQTVSDYAQVIQSGGELPPIKVYFDGAEYWLADGFHRWHAHKQAGRASIQADVTDGSRREAVLYSVGANASHGLRRSNADKRKAVETLLSDAEWAQWSDAQIAKACGVSGAYVGQVRASLTLNVYSEDPKERTFTTKHGTEAKMQTEKIGKRQNIIERTQEQVESAHGPADDFGPSEEELQAARQEQVELDRVAQEQRDMLDKVAQSDDKLSAALEENKRLIAQNRALQDRLNGLMSEKEAAIRQVKALQAKLTKAGVK